MRGSAAFRVAVAPGGALAGPWVQNSLWTAARAVPSLDLRFADNKSLVDAVTGASLVTFTRASSGTFVGSDGALQTATTNEPRFDHNPLTGESLGLLVEEARTNSIRNNTMVGAVAGTPGTLPTNWPTPSLRGVTQTLAVSIVSGVTCLDFQLSGTPTSTGNINIALCEPTNGIAASSGQTWTGSTYVVLSAGSLTNIGTVSLYIQENSVTNTFLASSSVSYVPAAGALLSTRWTNTRTLTNALTAFVNQGITLGVTTGQAIDITLRIGLPQLEQGAFATSVIPTTTATVTRAADVASISGSNFSSWYRADEGTVFADIISAPVNTIAQRVCDFTNSATPTQDRTFTRRNTSGGLATAVRTGNVLQIDQSTGVTVAGGGQYRYTFAYRPAVFASTANGVTATESSITTYPTVNQVALGQAYDNTQYLNGTIRRLTFWPTRLTTLQQITQP